MRQTGKVTGADAAPPAARWAGRLIAARAADDEAGYAALLQAPAEGGELGDCIMALLSMVALNLTRAGASG